MTSNQVLSEVEFNVVGKRPVRPDGVDKVTGRARYGADTNQTGTLQAKVLRSPHSHARIKSIDTSKAEALPGVRAVVTSKDLPFASLAKDELGSVLPRACTRYSSPSWRTPPSSAASALLVSCWPPRPCWTRSQMPTKAASATGWRATSAAAPVTTRLSAPCFR